MAPGRVHLSVADARDLAEGALRGIGFDHDEARIVADHVIDAALCGYEYSGLAKILNIVDSEHFKLPRRPMKVLRETDVSIAFEGGNNVGMLSLFYAAEATIKKAAAHGIALISRLLPCASAEDDRGRLTESGRAFANFCSPRPYTNSNPQKCFGVAITDNRQQ